MPASTEKIDSRLKEWCTESQARYIDAVNEYGSMRAAARALKVNYYTVHCAINRAQASAARRGYAPDHDMVRTVPEGFKVKGVSTYYNDEGKPVGQWVKSEADKQAQEALVREAIAALSEEVKGLAPLIDRPQKANSELLAVYPLGDPHIGLYAWAKECGADFDLPEAERVTLAAVDRLVETAPAAETAIVLPLGDTFHANDQTNQTPAHKHQLDVDSRFVKVLAVGIKIFRHAILRALQKHSKVVVRFVAGNHDPQAVWALAFTIAAYFDNEPRVEVDLSPAAHWFYRFGKVLIGATHGDKSKAKDLPGVMACDRARDWGETLYRYWYCGHVHHSSVQEFPGVSVETFRTLAAADSHAAGYGYRAGRDMRLIVHHREFGEIERHRCDVAMLENT